MASMASVSLIPFGAMKYESIYNGFPHSFYLKEVRWKRLEQMQIRTNNQHSPIFFLIEGCQDYHNWTTTVDGFDVATFVIHLNNIPPMQLTHRSQGKGGPKLPNIGENSRSEPATWELMKRFEEKFDRLSSILEQVAMASLATSQRLDSLAGTVENALTSNVRSTKKLNKTATSIEQILMAMVKGSGIPGGTQHTSDLKEEITDPTLLETHQRLQEGAEVYAPDSELKK